MKTAWFSALLFITLVGTAQADVLYQFAVNGADSIKPFSFSFTRPTFADNGSSLSFAPFAATDGTNSWTLVQGRAVDACFEFGTSGASLVNCGFIVPDGSSEGGFNLNVLGGALPRATGSYAFDGEGTFLSNGNLNFVVLTGNLTVSKASAVPEPSSTVSLCIAMIALIAGSCLRNRNREKPQTIAPGKRAYEDKTTILGTPAFVAVADLLLAHCRTTNQHQRHTIGNSVAEGVRFELTVALRLRQFSRLEP